MNVVRLVDVRATELSLDEVRAAVADPNAGGIALFAGAVRDNDQATVPSWKHQQFTGGDREWVGSA